MVYKHSKIPIFQRLSQRLRRARPRETYPSNHNSCFSDKRLDDLRFLLKNAFAECFYMKWIADLTSARASSYESPSPTITPFNPRGYATYPSGCFSTIIFTDLTMIKFLSQDHHLLINHIGAMRGSDEGHSLFFIILNNLLPLIFRFFLTMI